MTTGFLLFAYNNEEISYGVMAFWQARRIKKWLDKPVSLVTDQNTTDQLDTDYPGWRECFDKIIVENVVTNQTKRFVDRQLTFHNLNRIDAYRLTPYDETIVIDTDIVIQSTQLNKLWGHQEDLVVCEHSYDLFDRSSLEFKYLSEYSIKFYWATIFYFKKSTTAQMFFEECSKIKSNYLWHRHIHNLILGPVRNDFIWSIAIHNLNIESTIPWELLYTLPEADIVKLSQDSVVMLNDGKICRLEGQELHVMNKFKLMSEITKELAE